MSSENSVAKIENSGPCGGQGDATGICHEITDKNTANAGACAPPNVEECDKQIGDNQPEPKSHENVVSEAQPESENKKAPMSETDIKNAVADDKLLEKVNQLSISQDKEANNNRTTTGTVVTNAKSAALKIIQGYDSESSDDSDDDEIDEVNGVDEEELDYFSLDEDDGCEIENSRNKRKDGDPKKDALKVKGELSLDELPPVPDISTISLDTKEEYLHMGDIAYILDKLVTIEALPNMPAYDIDTLLFLEKGKSALGFIFDIVGPVSSPLYVVRFNSTQDIENLHLERGTKVFCAPKSQHTQYVFLQQLLKIRGSDASWVGDSEVPLELEEFSDDDAEHHKRTGGKTSGPQYGKRKRNSLERHQNFEHSMNKINNLNTRIHTFIDARNPLRQHIRPSASGAPAPPSFGAPMVDQMAAAPVYFDPSVPPPGFPGFVGQPPLPPSAMGAAPQYPGGFYAAPYGRGYNMPAASPNSGGFVYAPGPTTYNYYTNNIRPNRPGPSHRQ